MTIAVIFYDNGSTHKLQFKGYNLGKMNDIVNNNIAGYPKLTVHHVAVWLER